MIQPPWVNDPSAFVILDWSWWLNRACHGKHGPEGMLPLIVGWLCSLLGWEPAHLAIALDAPGETHRHRMRHPLDPDWRYKANRPPKPPSFAYQAKTATEIAELHGIPCLWADGCEADDVIATACTKAREAGYRVWIATADKDLHHLVERVDDPRGKNLVVGTWNPFEGDDWTARGPEEVRAHYGVEPAQIPDWLAICGDDSDGVPGVGHGLGPSRAAAILAAYGTLAEALAAPVWSSTKVEEIEGEIKALGKLIAKRKKGASDGVRGAVEGRSGGSGGVDRVLGGAGAVARGDGAAGSGACGDAQGAPRVPAPADELTARREALMEAKRVEGYRLTLKAHETEALFSRELTVLDCDAPVDVPWEEIPLGGYDVEALRALFTKLGYTRRAAEVPHRSKRAPWRLPWMADEGAPAPRRTDVRYQGGAEGERGRAIRDRRDGQFRHEAADALPQRDAGEGREGDPGAGRDEVAPAPVDMDKVAAAWGEMRAMGAQIRARQEARSDDEKEGAYPERGGLRAGAEVASDAIPRRALEAGGVLADDVGEEAGAGETVLSAPAPAGPDARAEGDRRGSRSGMPVLRDAVGEGLPRAVPVLTAPIVAPRTGPSDEESDERDWNIVAVKVKSALSKSALVRKYLVEDLEKGEKYRLHPDDVARFVGELRAKGVAA